LAAILPGLGRNSLSAGSYATRFAVLVPLGLAGALLAWRFSPAVEAPAAGGGLSTTRS
jgi:hypothetical protein